jgi:hypothetical protein
MPEGALSYCRATEVDNTGTIAADRARVARGCPDVEDDVGAIVADSGAVLVTALGDRQLAGSRGPSINP